MNENSQMQYLIRKFVEGKVSEEELDVLQDFLKTPEGLAALETVMNEHQLEFVQDQVTFLRSVSQLPEHRTKRRIHPGLAVAASLIGIFIVASIYLYLSRKPDLVHYQTEAGQTLELLLPDNTKVTLNARSTLSYQRDWSDAPERKVTLVGEALFKVVHNAQVPFLVYADGVNVRVLGTTFDVKSYQDDISVETTLVEGKVVIENQGKSLLELRPNQKAVYNKGNGQILLEEASSELETSWTRGVLVFEDKPFGEIIKVLQRRYGVKIEVSNETSLNCKFNATIENESLADVLKLFGSNGTMKYEMRGSDSVLIHGSVCGV